MSLRPACAIPRLSQKQKDKIRKQVISREGKEKYLLRDANSQDQDLESIKAVKLISQYLTSIQYAFRLYHTLISVQIPPEFHGILHNKYR